MSAFFKELTMSETKSAKILVTVPADLHERAQAKANEMRRSLSGYVAFVLDRELPPPTSVGNRLERSITNKIAELEASLAEHEGKPCVFIKDADGVLRPFPVEGDTRSVIRGYASALVLRQYADTVARMVHPALFDSR